MACKRSGVRSPLAPFFYYMQNFLLSLKTFFKTKLFFFILLTVIAFLLYGKSINYDFINLDEETLIQNNIEYLSSTKNIPIFFLTSCYFTKTSFYYRPILTISFSLESALFGLNKKIYHFTNIILFILSLYLMYLFSLKININEQIVKFIILLFCIHPIFTTLPVWIPGRNDTLATIFIILSFINFISYIKYHKKLNLFLLISFFTLSIFTKESTIFLFILYPLFLYCFQYKISKKKLFRIYTYLFLIIFIYLFLRNISVASIGIQNFFTNYFEHLNNCFFGISNYIYFFFIPNNIPTLFFNETTSYTHLFIFFLITLALSIFYYKNVNYHKELLFSTVWFLIFLLPTFLQKEYVFLTHRLFISSVGFLIILSLFIEKLIKTFPSTKKILIYIFIVIFVLLFYLSFNFQNIYTNKQTYWQQAYIDAPKYHLVSYNLANLYLQHENYEKYKEFMFQAYNLSNGDVHIFNIMPILIKEGQIDKVKEICFNILQDKDAKLFHQIGANSTLGNIYLEKGNLSEAYKYLKTALMLDKHNFDLQNKVKLLETKLNGN